MSTELQSNSVAEESTTLKLHRADLEAFQESCWESLTKSLNLRVRRGLIDVPQS